MTNLTPQQIREAIQRGMEETWRLIDAGKKIELRPEPLRRTRDVAAEETDHDENDT